MTPYLTARGVWMLASAALLLGVGAATARVPPLLAGEALLAFVSATYLVAITRMWAIERGALHVTLRRDRQRGELHRGEEHTFRVSLTNTSALGFGRAVLSARRSSGLVLPEELRFDRLHPCSDTEASVGISARRAGRWTVHGLEGAVEDVTGLVRIAVYLPLTEHVKVWPARRAAAAARLPVARKRALLPMGANLADRKGQGFELRELRDYAPGDSIRRVDWKASARRRALTVRELEEEVVNDIALVLDVSSSMHGGSAWAKFEHTLELAQDLVHACSIRGDRVGLVSVDDVIVGQLGQGSGAAHYRRALEHVVGLPGLVGEGQTECSDADVVLAVADYALVHERLDFRRGRTPDKLDSFAPVAELVDCELLDRWVEERLRAEAGPLEAELAAAGFSSAGLSLTRRFARIRGIELPYRVEARLGRRASGLSTGIEAAVRGIRGGGVAFVLSDLAGLYDADDIGRALDLARARRVRVLVAQPFTPAYVDVPEDELGDAVHGLFAYAEGVDHEAIRSQLAARGVPVLPVGQTTTAAHLLAVASVRR